MKEEIQILLETDSRLKAEDIQSILGDEDIHVLLESDNAASSVLNAYAGPNVMESIKVLVNNDDFYRAVEILKNTHYRHLL